MKLKKEIKRMTKGFTSPKLTMVWYVKWAASLIVRCAMSIRGIEGLQMWDLVLSAIGIALWLWVSILWKDRALILLNGVGLMFLFKNIMTSLYI